MKLRLFIAFFTLGIFATSVQAQCLEITSIFVNSCGIPEGENEMFTFEVGATALDVSNIVVDWPSNSFLGWCQNASTAASTAALNATITNGCGFLIEPTANVLPANANVIVITSTNFNVTYNSFSNLADTMYIVYQCSGNTQGHFSNNPSVSSTWPLGNRDLIVDVTAGPCLGRDSVAYDNAIQNVDGATAIYDAIGNVSYVNNGCNAPVISLSVDWTFTNRICDDYGNINLNALLNGNATTGGTWTGTNITNDSIFNPFGMSGIDSITYTIAGSTSCAATLDSTIIFSVVSPQTGASMVQSCDSAFVNGTWYMSSTNFSDTVFGSGFACDSFVNYTVVIDNAITDSIYLSNCTSVDFDGTTYTSSQIIRDTVFAGGGGPMVIDTILETSFEDSEGWTGHSSGNWTQTDANGTWNAVDMYANANSTNTGTRKVGMNDVGDYLEFPPVTNPQTLYYYDRLSSAASGTNELTVEYYDGSTWNVISADICTHTSYELVTVDLTSISALTNVAIRIIRTSDNRSAYIDDVTIVGSTQSMGASCDSIFITNIDILPAISGTNPGNPFVICATNDSVQLPSGLYAYSAGSYIDTLVGMAANGCDSIVTTVVQTQSCGCFFDDVSKTFWVKADTLLQNGGLPVTSGTTNLWGNIVSNPLIPNLNGLAGGGTRTILTNEPTFNFNSTIDFVGAGFNRGGLPNNAMLDPDEGAMFVVSTQAGLSFSYVVGTASTGTCGGNRCSSGFRGNRSEFGSANDLFVGTTNPGVANVLGMQGNANTTSQRNSVNGVLALSNAANSIPASTATVTYNVGIGVWPGFTMTGKVAEAIAFNRELTLTEYERVESYLALKYGATLTHNYYASDFDGISGTVPYFLGFGYDNNIAGIGRDDCFELEQIKSHSVAPGAIVTMSLTDNGGTYTNPNTFDNNLDFLAWGNNGATADLACSTNVPAGYNQLYNRIWRSQQSGVVGTTSIGFDITAAGLTAPATDYALVIDTDDDMFYDDETPITGTIVGNDLVFDNIDLDNHTFTLVLNSQVEITINDQICNNGTYTLPSGTVVSSPGTYIDTVVNSVSCDSIITTNLITVICDCSFDLGPDTAFCQGGSVLLDAGPGFDTYQWQNNSSNQTFNASTTGTYFCTTTFIDYNNNLVVNGDFEQGNTLFTTDYGPGVGGAFGLLTNPGTYAVNTLPSNVHNNFQSCTDHTSGSGNMMIVNGANTANTNVWCQTINVAPNTDYNFSAWAISLENTNSSNVATLHFLIDGVQIGSNFSPSFTACNWQQFSATWNSGSSTSISICIESDVIAGNNDYAIDDIFFTPYCEYTDSVDVTVHAIPAPDLGPDFAICQGTDTLLDATTANASYLWQDGTTTSATFTAQTAGTYFVDVTVNNCTGSDAVEITVNPVYNETANVRICEGDSAFLENDWQTQSGVYTDVFNSASTCDSTVVTTLTILGSQTTNETITLCLDELPTTIFGNLESTPGLYSDTLSNSLGCDSIISNIDLVVNPLPNVFLGTDTTIEEGTVLTINVNNSNSSDTYTWINSLGESFSGESIIANANETAEYILTTVNEFNCTSLDSIQVVVNPLEETLLLVPTAFSPNGDGINESFRIANFEDFESYTLKVYNRWGELIFDNQGYNVAWDGFYQGVKQNVGTYAFYIEALPINGGSVLKTSGNVTLIR